MILPQSSIGWMMHFEIHLRQFKKEPGQELGHDGQLIEFLEGQGGWCVAKGSIT